MFSRERKDTTRKSRLRPALPGKRDALPAQPAQTDPLVEIVQRYADPQQTRLAETIRGAGQPLDESLRASMEQAFGADLSGVQVHTDTRAAALNQSLGAQAFTRGSDIFFGKDTYAPGTPGGRQLIAHELTHVVQNRRAGATGGLQPKWTVSRPGSAAEREADSLGQRAASGQRVAVQAAPDGGIQRQLGHAVVLGGGPIGLLSAIEAKLNGAENVTVYEKRLEQYSRKNIPTLNSHTIQKLKAVGVYERIFGESWTDTARAWLGQEVPKGLALPGSEAQISLQVLETVLAERALELGVRIERGYVPVGIESLNEQQDEGREKEKKTAGRAGQVRLRFEHVKSAADPSSNPYLGFELNERGATSEHVVPRHLETTADLLIVAVGAGASENDFVTKTLGFNYNKLKAKDYSVYGIFDKPTPREKLGTRASKAWSKLRGAAPQHPTFEQSRKSSRHQSAVAGQGGILRSGGAVTSFITPQHNYILGFLNGLSKLDFKDLQANPQKLRQILEHAGISRREGFEKLSNSPKSANLFKVKIRQARNFVSPDYPAVLVGDAAVTPHPRTGSGVNTGVANLPAIATLVQGLAQGGPQRNEQKAFQDYHKTTAIQTTALVVKALDAMAEGIRVAIHEFLPFHDDQWQAAFAERYGSEWFDWYMPRNQVLDRHKLEALAESIKRNNHIDMQHFRQAWVTLNEIYEVIQWTTKNWGVRNLDRKLKILEDNRY